MVASRGDGIAMKVKVKVAQSCPTLCDPMDYMVHGILQARKLEWVAFSFSRGSSQPRDWTQVSCIAGGFFTSWATREPWECREEWLNKDEALLACSPTAHILLCGPVPNRPGTSTCPWLGDWNYNSTSSNSTTVCGFLWFFPNTCTKCAHIHTRSCFVYEWNLYSHTIFETYFPLLSLSLFNTMFATLCDILSAYLTHMKKVVQRGDTKWPQ